MPRSLDVPPVDRVDTLAHELALLNSQAKRSIAMLGSRHVAMTTSHLVEL
ncbi:MAG: DNA recombination-mediator protein A, partial [Cyanobacteria bacterium MAG APA_bin_95]|nr:DNA recombination-mediator protein A [Cyanobacteria bacterium MAG APA_bin_95]